MSPVAVASLLPQNNNAHGHLRTASPFVDPKEYVERLSDIWQRNVALMRETEAAVERLARYERERSEGTFSAARNIIDANALEHTCEALVRKLVAVATTYFAPPGGEPLVIDEDKVRAETIGDAVHQERWEMIDLRKVWETIERRYGGGAGVEESYRKSAKTIVSHLRLYDHEVTERAGRVLVDVRVWVDAYEAVPALSYQSRDRIDELNRALAAFASWAGEDETAARLSGLVTRWDSGVGSRTIKSRERLNVSEHIDIVTYQQRFEYRLTKTLAERLMVFVSTFSPPHPDE